MTISKATATATLSPDEPTFVHFIQVSNGQRHYDMDEARTTRHAGAKFGSGKQRFISNGYAATRIPIYIYNTYYVYTSGTPKTLLPLLVVSFLLLLKFASQS